MAKSSTLLQAGKHNETVFITQLFPTIAHNSEDRAVIAYMISQAFKKKEAEQEKNG
jgi:hypothetical protein